jgi:hypothetical protein
MKKSYTLTVSVYRSVGPWIHLFKDRDSQYLRYIEREYNRDIREAMDRIRTVVNLLR